METLALQSLRVTPFSPGDVPAVKAFNRRLREGGLPPEYQFSEAPVPEWLPYTSGTPVYNEFFLVWDSSDAVRGTFVLKHQKFSFRGDIRPVAYYHHPFSEGIIDKRFTHVGAYMLMHALRRHPVMYALGMGGYDRPLPRMLLAMQWKHRLLPFYFRVNRPARFLREIRALRQNTWKRLAADAAAYSGVGWIALQAAQSAMGRCPAADAERVSGFGEWADEVWEESKAAYSIIAVRDAASLRKLYPESNTNFVLLSVKKQGRIIGWAVVSDRQKDRDPQYGNLRVGVILDCFSRPEHSAHIIAAATRVLTDRGVDLITSNQSHASWCRALRRCGFLKGPSNFIFAASKGLSSQLGPFNENVDSGHLNRGDGDNLLQYI